jgi:ATP-dependent exoDNAse (exonuclease V) beta subunit
MSSLQALIQRNLAEANSALLARTASTLSRALQTGDAEFILEKAGIRYRHVLIDEFQDTSQLQWSVIERLLKDVLAGAGNTLLIVGDIKQSIYRWRNGDWHIMDSLTNDEQHPLTRERLNGRFTSLTRNFRSSEEVVRFNLSLFTDIIRRAGDPLVARIYDEQFALDRLRSFYQSGKKDGGYVRFRAIPNAKPVDLAMEM